MPSPFCWVEHKATLSEGSVPITPEVLKNTIDKERELLALLHERLKRSTYLKKRCVEAIADLHELEKFANGVNFNIQTLGAAGAGILLFLATNTRKTVEAAISKLGNDVIVAPYDLDS